MRIAKSKSVKLVLALPILAFFSVFLINIPHANAAYDGARIIDNHIFLNANAMNRDQIQSFLASKQSGLASRSFQLNCYGPSSKERQLYNAVGAPCDQVIPASHIIYYASQIYGINPSVILATMQKEQSLITTQNPTDWQINQAMGYGCPTTGNCSGNSTFSYQIDSGAWVLRYHYERANGNMTWWSTSTSWTCGTEKNFYKPNLYPRQNVHFYDGNGVHYRTYYLANAATSSFYCYTPHAYNNPQGLYGRAPFGHTGQYYSGSYNFVTFFELWFGPTIETYKPAPLSRQAGSPVTLARNADNTLQSVGVTSVDTFYQRRQGTPSANTWTSWTSIDGWLRNVTSETNADGRVQLLGVAGNGDIYTRAQTAANSTTWTSWTRVDGALTSATLVRNSTGVLQIIGLAENDLIYTRSQTAPNSNEWTGWTQLDGALRNVTSETNADGRVQLLGVAGNGDIYTRAQTAANSTTWTSWTRVDGALKKASLVRNSDGTLQVIGVTNGETIYTKRQTAPNSNEWTGWTQLDGALRNVTSETNADGRVQLLGVAGNGDIYTRAQTAANSTTWTSWTRVDGAFRQW